MSTYPYLKPFDVGHIKSGAPNATFTENFGNIFKQRTNKPGFTKITYKAGQRIEVTKK